MSINTIAGTAGRITGTAAKGLIWAHRTIDWAEVAQIVIEGLKVLVVLTLLAGRATRRQFWDNLPGWSEQVGRLYGQLLTNSFSYSWSCGTLIEVRYFIGRKYEYIFGYEPESNDWPFRLARWAGLSGY
jgi:hypothetical protein